MVTGGKTGQISEIDPGNAEAASTRATTSIMGFTILIVRRRGVILCKGQGKSCGFPGPKAGFGAPAPSSRRGNCTRDPKVEIGGNPPLLGKNEGWGTLIGGKVKIPKSLGCATRQNLRG